MTDHTQANGIIPGVGADVGAMLTVGAEVSTGVGLAEGEQDPPVL